MGEGALALGDRVGVGEARGRAEVAILDLSNRIERREEGIPA